MAISKDKKAEILAKLQKITKESKSMAFMNFHGISVADVTAVRRKLRENGVGYFVAKKSLLRKAMTEAGYAGTMPDLGGELGVAYSTDLIAPAREVYGFEKKLEKGAKLLGGVFEGTYKSQAEMTVIALIPSMKTLHGMFANIINSPIQRFVIGLDQIAKKKTV